MPVVLAGHSRVGAIKARKNSEPKFLLEPGKKEMRFKGAGVDVQNGEAPNPISIAVL
jgi:hypothetical protein